MYLLLLLAVIAGSAFGQEKLTLEQAVSAALANHGSIQAGASALKVADARIAQARGSRMPQVSYSESWMRSNNQVFVFGSLLTQRQFQAANFDIHFLNEPPFANNFQSQVIVDQSLYDNGRRQSQIRSAELGREVAVQDNRRTEIDLISSVAAAYSGVQLAQRALHVAHEALKSADADLKRAEARRAAGMTTDADVLSIRVHSAAVREQVIRRQSDLDLAMAALNQAMGLPLETPHTLATELTTYTTDAAAPADAAGVSAGRPEIRQIQLALNIGEQQARAAKAARLPEFYFRAGFEADRQRFVTRGGANWIAAAGLRWNLFDGGADRARQAEAQAGIDRVRAQAKVVESGVQLAARRAALDLQSAGQRVEVAKATVDMARESLRITKNRYEAGLADITELLRSETALLEVETRQLEAIRDQRLAAVALEAAWGKLTKNSDVVVR